MATGTLLGPEGTDPAVHCRERLLSPHEDADGFDRRRRFSTGGPIVRRTALHLRNRSEWLAIEDHDRDAPAP